MECERRGTGSLEEKLLDVPLPERKVARRTLALSCGYSGVYTLFTESWSRNKC